MHSLIGPRSNSGRTIAALVAVAVAVAWSSTARAQEPNDYCQRITARADGDAALLFSPTLHAQVIRFPNAGAAADATGLQAGRGVQPRAALSIGLFDIYRGLGVLDVARADCSRQRSALGLEEIVAQGADVGRLVALQRKLTFLREHRSVVEEIVRHAEERFAAQTATLSEVQELRMHALRFERGVLETERDIKVLEARGAAPPSQSVAEELRTYEQHSVEVERRVAHVRNLAPWKLSVTGGVTGSPAVDGFGVAELSYNFGGLFQLGAERRAIQARAGELKNARYEMRQQIERMTRGLRQSAEQSRAEADAIGAAVARMTRDRAALEGTDAPNKRGMIGAMTLQILDLEAEHAFLAALAEKQSAFGGAR